MKQKIEIEKLFQEKLGNLESPVSPDVWANIASSIGGATGATALVKTSMSGLMKTIIVSGGVVAAGLVTAYIVSQQGEEKSNISQINAPNENTELVLVGDGIVFDQDGDTAIESDRENIVNELKNSPLPERVFTPEMVQQVLIEIEESNTEDINLDEIIKSIEEDFGTTSADNNSVNLPENEQTIEDPLDYSETEEGAEADELVLTEELSNVVIAGAEANVFTPNGDNINDRWTVTFENAEEVIIQIFNKTGNKVFDSEEMEFSWDGTDQFGNELDKGGYYYHIIGKDTEGKPFWKQGSIVLE